MADQVENASAVRTTSDWMAVIRHRESTEPDAYLVDPYAERLGGSEALVAYLAKLGGPNEVVITRGRFGDAVIAEALGSGVDQVAILASGSDTRPWRLPMPGATVYEADLPGQVETKIATLARAGVSPAGQVAVDVDLRTPWAGRLTEAGLDPRRPAVFLVEGLFYYFPADEADLLLDRLGSIAAEGSRLAFDIPDSAYADEPANAEFLAYMLDRGSPFVGASADPVRWLAGHGWDASAYLAADLGSSGLVPAPPARLVRPDRPIWHVGARRR
ncbi:methyltransferase (TIGR00027 family) [Hamadaea flava]|uniref:S-adenosyl-L-methionine-dependent methyltransferase n=1 Tax=Hamadaea flava TaxID=1742688 RepID=A0ABV8LQU9_9ACTN|nr:SAM-dependent methyltransferase [Hamadaea flava]MCP2322667.1 methyltransferase (TIGR00027 family) [Hamadaea flava]